MNKTATVTREKLNAEVDGKPLEQFVLTNKNGLRAVVLNWGGTLTSVETPDRNGKLDNIVCGFSPDNEKFLKNPPYFKNFGLSGEKPSTMLSSLPFRSGVSTEASVPPQLRTTARKPFLFVSTNCSSCLPSTSALIFSRVTVADLFMSASLLEGVDSGFDSPEGDAVGPSGNGRGGGSGGLGSGALAGGVCSQPNDSTVITLNNPKNNHR